VHVFGWWEKPGKMKRACNLHTERPQPDGEATMLAAAPLVVSNVNKTSCDLKNTETCL